ncbi:UPF0193 protein EVG1 homolog isoform X2 [Fopius arisanus]|nr:PREDICTED: UPF0193 protein EVG1 homolog isoform X2 [Fopius arisanus]
MEESKLSMIQRIPIKNAINRGEPLPLPSKVTTPQKDKHTTSFSHYWRKRSQEAIVNGGAYEREQYRRTTPLLNKDEQKRFLACMMTYGKEVPETPHKSVLRHCRQTELERRADVEHADYLTQGIRERIEFLQEMESLGLGKKYKSIIQDEIAQKISSIDSLPKKNSVKILMY